MSNVQWPEVRIGEPVGTSLVEVFPLFTATPACGVVYQLADEGLQREGLVAGEVSRTGVVSEITIENRGDTMVLLLEGEELIGAKQNRVLNTTVLVKPKSKIKIPVSCVEAGRWSYVYQRFYHSQRRVFHSLHYELKRGVHESLKARRGHMSDQGQVWEKVALACANLSVRSGTMALADAYRQYQSFSHRLCEEVPYVDGATGFAITMDGHVIALDLFDRSDTCQRAWLRAMAGLALDVATRSEPRMKRAQRYDVEQFWAAAIQWPWKPVETVGEGQEYRAESAAGHQGSALMYDGTLVHLSIVSPFQQHMEEFPRPWTAGVGPSGA